MTAATRIIVDRRDDVLRVPNQALHYAPGGLANAGTEQRVWVLRDGRPVPIVIEAGLDDENFTEIVKGDLRPGDAVITGAERGANGGASALAAPRS